MTHYEVICGNIGRVYSGSNSIEANGTYAEYVSQSKKNYGRAGRESVYLMLDGEPIVEHQGSMNDDE